MSRYVCTICGFIYDEAAGLPDQGIAAGTKWGDLPADWVCPVCGSPKSAFELVKEEQPARSAAKTAEAAEVDDMRQLSFGELSAMCSNLALQCEKQQLSRQEALLRKLSDVFLEKAGVASSGSFEGLLEKVNQDLGSPFTTADKAADDASDRGAKRILVWSRKVSVIVQGLLDRFGKEGDALLEKTNVWVCSICGFVYVGETPPAVCPVCKVPSFKILAVERR